MITSIPRHFHMLTTNFRIPLLVLLGIFLYIVFMVMHLPTTAFVIAIVSIILGSYELFVDSYNSLLKKQFALDYIAILAIVVSLITKEYLVGMVIALMIASGRNLEEYGVSSAKKSLTQLIDRIPKDVLLWKDHKADGKVSIEKITVGQEIFIRKGEVIPLDGELLTPTAIIDESSLTGEPYPVDKIQGDIVHSGTVNVGNPLQIAVTREEKDSTYRKIINLVEKTQGEKAPLVRLADRYSTYFTFVTFVLAGIAYALRPGLESVLAVLVVATPCPLILATPIALLGGVNAAAKRRIIVKQLASLEVLSKVNAIIFDKTGTITLGKPKVTQASFFNERHPELDSGSLDSGQARMTKEQIILLSIASAIERNSLHPLAKAIVAYATEKKAPIIHAEHVEEKIGQGISGNVNGKIYTLKKVEKESSGMSIALFEEKKLVATFLFEDEIKEDAREIVKKLEEQHILLGLLTGDKQEAAEKVKNQLGRNILIKAEASPEDKAAFIKDLQSNKNIGNLTFEIGSIGYSTTQRVVAMIGDGINDAPALALADVGMVFSSEEQTAATNAADIVFLGGTFAAVESALHVARQTIRIAMQSILWGIGLSILAMIVAAFGLLPPLFGAGIQEAIDVAVIINALRAAK